MPPALPHARAYLGALPRCDGFTAQAEDPSCLGLSTPRPSSDSVAGVADAPRPLTGRCLCGRVTYTVDADPVVQAACFCTECQRQTGSPFSTLVGVPRESLEVSGDTLASFTTVGEDHGGDTERHFCSACGSPVFSLAAVAPALAFLKTGSLDDASWVRPAVEVWTRSAQPWSPHFEGAARLERGP